MKQIVLTGVLLLGLAATPALANEIVIDFGIADQGSVAYAGAFDGSSGFVGVDLAAPQPPADLVVDLGGGRSLTLGNVGGWNNSPTSDPADVQTLLLDHVFSAGFGADDPVTITLGGFSPSDEVTLEFVGRMDKVQSALVDFGVPTIIAGGSDPGLGFTSVGTFSGATSYVGTMTGETGSGEGNLAGARVTIVPEPTAFVLLIAGLLVCRRR